MARTIYNNSAVADRRLIMLIMMSDVTLPQRTRFHTATLVPTTQGLSKVLWQ